MNFTNFTNFGIAIRPLAWVALLFLHLSWAGVAHAQSPARIGIILFDGVLSSDVTAPMEVLGSAIADETLTNTSHYNRTSRWCDHLTRGDQTGGRLRHGECAEIDVLIVGSRYDMDSLLDDQAFMSFIRERGSKAKWLASNCSGAYILAKAGFLTGRKRQRIPEARHGSS